jgi:hypothetical protein
MDAKTKNPISESKISEGTKESDIKKTSTSAKSKKLTTIQEKTLKLMLEIRREDNEIHKEEKEKMMNRILATGAVGVSLGAAASAIFYPELVNSPLIAGLMAGWGSSLLFSLGLAEHSKKRIYRLQKKLTKLIGIKDATKIIDMAVNNKKDKNEDDFGMIRRD